ncbi:multicopper oxidase [Thelonectria olida]|uniref:laccase n=1 Tax=Thelonectria olida TaxID=1576542 RepID=A0A9P8VTZ6_9HYPO|nr:multicopper oxidase [Thelonectria olida]
MRSILSFLLAAGSLVSAAPGLGFPKRAPVLVPRSNSSSSPSLPSSACSGNTPSTRSEWCQYSIDTDYATEYVDTGVTREYWLELTDVVVAPDGIKRPAMAVNGSIPGPTLYADWGDTVTVHVKNSLTHSLNGTSIHWHGIRQNHTYENDGTSAVSQCPLVPGETQTYTWKAEQYGTSWYHSHFVLQAWQGVFGGLVINGPASANYDEDLGVLFLNDWSHQTVDELHHWAAVHGPPTSDTGLINGTNIWVAEDNVTTTGERFKLKFESGKSYRLRLVGAAIDSHFKFSIDNHTMTVISADLVPVEPFVTDTIQVGMGQRYDVVIKADQADLCDNFWLRAVPQSDCSQNHHGDNVKGIVYYGDEPSTPETYPHDTETTCEDNTSDLIPVVPHQVDHADWTDVESASVSNQSLGLFKWYLNSTTMVLDWKKPTIKQVLDGVADYEKDDAIFEIYGVDQWVYFIIETDLPIPHPIHLHGHDFYVLAQGSGEYTEHTPLDLTNPPRRDTALLPGPGHLVMAWKTDNPGAWLLHCHIGWHMSEGFAVQFLEREDELEQISNKEMIDDQCATWSAFQDEQGIHQWDSGI